MGLTRGESKLKAEGTTICSYILLLSFVVGCEGAPLSVSPHAEVGLFYGGQIQRVQRAEFSRVHPPKLGFRVRVPPSNSMPLASRTIRFAINRPGPAGRRVTRRGELQVPEGQERLDHLLKVDENAPLGIWNIRVTMNEKILADRAVFLVRSH